MTKNHQENTTQGSSGIPKKPRWNSSTRPTREAARTDAGASNKNMTTELENTTDMTRPENTTYSGMRGNIITFLTERQDQLCEQLNTKIERLDQRLILLEDQEQKRGRP